ncbi:MAG: Smr/MutS family protein [Candidatus Uhrbacteria bacterium]|nr:Smr/MutS family protein [Candidatus Uhrbacteria bacterium]
MTHKENSERSELLDTLILVAQENPDTPTVDLHSLDVNEARAVLDKFLDSQFMAGDKVVQIVTGTGKGILSREMRDVLERSSYIKHYESFGPVIYSVLNNF